MYRWPIEMSVAILWVVLNLVKDVLGACGDCECWLQPWLEICSEILSQIRFGVCCWCSSVSALTGRGVACCTQLGCLAAAHARHLLRAELVAVVGVSSRPWGFSLAVCLCRGHGCEEKMAEPYIAVHRQLSVLNRQAV